MKLMNKLNLKIFIQSELQLYKVNYKEKKYSSAFKHLERIHIVSQPYPINHTLIHLRMLHFAILTFSPFEILVQTLYSIFSFKFSLLGIFPQGNTGGANAIKKGRMSIPNDLQKLVQL